MKKRLWIMLTALTTYNASAETLYCIDKMRVGIAVGKDGIPRELGYAPTALSRFTIQLDRSSQRLETSELAFSDSMWNSGTVNCTTVQLSLEITDMILTCTNHWVGDSIRLNLNDLTYRAANLDYQYPSTVRHGQCEAF